ncbi:hypothetical protein [Planotetraspora kaengkrachanensis]|uniref:hypothetical protein n=1 Tax=Planotetraspora kaengkrachanensis TaxID=575193 RepID=UPI001944D893|nr:hypothetical protein [Planotetraspora kaengkrachanensis]
MIEGYRWRLVMDEVISHRYQEIVEAAEGSLVETEQLVMMFGDDAQLIDGELTAHDADGAIVDLKICALDRPLQPCGAARIPCRPWSAAGLL